MSTRRDFIITTAATASNPLTAQAATEQGKRLPLKALPRVRTIFARPADDGRLLMVSDGPEAPRKLIRRDSLERAFGRGADLVLQQPDHWRMIDEGWFPGEDLYDPNETEDSAYLAWHANYRPEIEAHDLLYDIFRDEITSPFGARILEIGLELGEHPATPRYATAKLDGEWCIARFAAEVTARTSWLVIKSGSG